MKRLYILTLLAFATVVLSAQNIRFYKYGREVMVVNTYNVDSITTLTAEEHPLQTYISGKVVSVEPSTSGKQWEVKVSYDAKCYNFAFSDREDANPDTLTRYSFDDFAYSSNYTQSLRELGVSEVQDKGYINDSDSDKTGHYEMLVLMESEKKTFMYLIYDYGVPFYSKPIAITTGRLLNDAMQMAGCTKYVEVEGNIVGYNYSVIDQFISQHTDILGNIDPGKYVEEIAISYLQSLSFSQLDIASTVEYTGGVLHVLASIPEDGAEDFIRRYLQIGQTIVVDAGEYELPTDYRTNEPTMNDTLIDCRAEWNAPWAQYLEVSDKRIGQSQVTYSTPLLSPGQKYDLYATMVSDSLPTWFQFTYSEIKNNGSFDSHVTYYDNPNPVTADSDVPNADVISSQSRSERIFTTGTNTCERILIQRGISTTYLSPYRFTIMSCGPSSSKYREKIYTRTLRIAGIELVPSETE